ncbi:hypothetical protein L1987_79038 [Smallanthus sonchifolius]|uniref:Uncharacterized protein n=1 Tax=Smallanthus sonchifolius TaxID=185202 RepID=A0ACB8ZDI8_9ASTR|nr:hypothetical protein L1987_79038 [Smallanthus sonchifolius]
MIHMILQKKSQAIHTKFSVLEWDRKFIQVLGVSTKPRDIWTNYTKWFFTIISTPKKAHIPNLCQLVEEVGDDETALRLRSTGLEVLASMTAQSHVSMDFGFKVTRAEGVSFFTTQACVMLSRKPTSSFEADIPGGGSITCSHDHAKPEAHIASSKRYAFKEDKIHVSFSLATSGAFLKRAAPVAKYIPCITSININNNG